MSQLGLSSDSPTALRFASFPLTTIAKGQWPIDFFREAGILLWAVVYVFLGATWLIYQDQTRRRRKRIDIKAVRLIWNALCACFSVHATITLAPILYRSVKLHGITDSMCVGVTELLEHDIVAMVTLFLHVMFRLLKLYEVMFAEAHGTTEANDALVYHLTTPIYVWIMATHMSATSVGVAWAVCTEASHIVRYLYLLAKDVIWAKYGRTFTPAVANAVKLTQLPSLLMGFLIMATSDCGTALKGNFRIVALMLAGIYVAMAFKGFILALEPESDMQIVPVNDQDAAVKKAA